MVFLKKVGFLMIMSQINILETFPQKFSKYALLVIIAAKQL